MTKAELLALADRVEREEPNMELNASIAEAVGERISRLGSTILCRHYTTSLDAAASLVGSAPWAIRHIDGVTVAWVRGEPGNHAHPAAALTAAALRARAMEMPE